MKRLSIVVCLLIFGTFLTTTVADAQAGESRVVIEQVNDSNFPTVELVVTPFNSSGLPIPGLFPNQFTITEDGQPINDFQISQPTIEEQPISIMLVLDVSGSLRDSLGDLRQSVMRLYEVLELTDESALIAFSTGTNTTLSTDLATFDPARETNFTNDEGLLINLLNALAIEENSGSPLYDAVVKGVQRTAQDAQHSRRAVILFTDGRDSNAAGDALGSFTNTDPDQTLKLVQQAGIPVFTIGLGDAVDTAFLQQVAQVSGGSYSPVKDVSLMGDVLARTADQIRPSYKVTYTSQLVADGAPHTVEVAVQSESGTAVSSTTINTPAPDLPPPPAIASVDIVPPDANGVIRVTPTINSDGEIAAVRYYVDGSETAAETFTEPPYSFAWDTSTLSFAEEHLLRIEVEDVFGQVGSITQSISIPSPSEPAPTAVSEVVDETAVVAEPESASSGLLGQLEALLPFNPLILIGVVGFLFLLALVALFFILRSRKPAPQAAATAPPAPYQPFQPPTPQQGGFAPPAVQQPQFGNETAPQTTPFSGASDPSQTVYDPPSGAINRSGLETVEEPIFNPSTPAQDDNATFYDPMTEVGAPPTPSPKTVQLTPPGQSNSPKTEVLYFGDNQPPPAIFLDVTSGREYQIMNGGRIGRDPQNDIVFTEPSVSRFHAEVAIQGKQIVLKNLSQSNPVLINGQAQAQAFLQDGDRLEFGRLKLIFKQKH